MKMNKIIIPAAMLAVGVALVGSVSSTLAWYQYSTKAQAAYIGTSVGQSENLEIKIKDGVDAQSQPKYKWTTNATSKDINELAGVARNVKKEIIPISSGAMGKNATINPSNFHSGIETGVAGYRDLPVTSDNYVQFTLNIRYKNTSKDAGFEKRKLNLIDLTITDDTAAPNNDLYTAIRVHFSTGSTEADNFLYARDKALNNSTASEISTSTQSRLDTDNDGILDLPQKYEWEEGGTEPVVYGDTGTNPAQVAYNAAYRELDGESNIIPMSQTLGVMPADEDGLALTVTIWIEGWQKLTGLPENNYDGIGEGNFSSAMWKPETYTKKTFNVGMRFQAGDVVE